MYIEDRPIKWKRHARGARARDVPPAEDLARLAALQLAGTLARESAWLLLPLDVASLLDRLCIGRALLPPPPPLPAAVARRRRQATGGRARARRLLLSLTSLHVPRAQAPGV